MFPYTEEPDSIYIWSSRIAMRDEVLHGFNNRLFSPQGMLISFSAFFIYMSYTYSAFNRNAAKFLSKFCFVNLYYGWLYTKYVKCFSRHFFGQYGHLNDNCLHQKCLPVMEPMLGHLCDFCNTLVPLKLRTEQILLSQQATNALTEPLLQIFMVKKQDPF